MNLCMALSLQQAQDQAIKNEPGKTRLPLPIRGHSSNSCPSPTTANLIWRISTLTSLQQRPIFLMGTQEDFEPTWHFPAKALGRVCSFVFFSQPKATSRALLYLRNNSPLDVLQDALKSR